MRALAGLPLLALVAALPAVAATHRPDGNLRARIARAVHRQVGGDVRVQLGSTAAMRYMPRCPRPPSITIRGAGADRDALVRCPHRHWRVYLPVTLARRTRVVVAARTLRTGATLARRDLRLVTRVVPLGQEGQAFHRLASVTGQTLTTALAAGTTVTAGILRQPQTVSSGQDVTVTVRSGAIAVKLTAVALQSGHPGQRILVRNPESGKRFQARVTRNGLVLDIGS
ncbi:MAG TPA: flagellar basal body P-ring formation chaperone FlgA [Gammaproteobacteria bacterium]|nr:flagellar basal body P-ring formation chaperone FlgA [Gammaproteobacteria bacterium]